MTRQQLLQRLAGVAVLAAVVPLVFLGCVGKPPEAADPLWPADHKGPKVVVSFAPLYCFAVNVAGDDAVVRNVMTTTGPHDFSPTERDVRVVTKADLFFVVGMGLDDSQAERMKEGSGNTNLKIIELAEKLPKDKLCEGKCNHAHHGDDHKHDLDPHVWLSPDHAALMVNMIRDELKAADPAHAAGYDARAAAYIKKLEAVKADGLALLKDKKDNRLISFHDSMAYFEKAFNLDVRDVLTKKPGQEPEEKAMRKLIRVATDEHKPTRVIAVEPQYSTSTSGEALKKELIAKGMKDVALVEFDTLETVKPDDLTAEWYERKMRANLEALAKALK
jgi:ABC-type Zn uptake system ZnuABC Zn-binding protein ZnuA